jgi:hypothetical protein
LDDSVVSRHVWFDMQQVDFLTAMRAAGSVTHTFWTPLQSAQIYLAADTPDNHRLFDHMGLRTFSVPVSLQPTALNDIVNSLRTLFEIKFLTQQAQSWRRLPATSTVWPIPARKSCWTLTFTTSDTR